MNGPTCPKCAGPTDWVTYHPDGSGRLFFVCKDRSCQGGMWSQPAPAASQAPAFEALVDAVASEAIAAGRFGSGAARAALLAHHSAVEKEVSELRAEVRHVKEGSLVDAHLGASLIRQRDEAHAALAAAVKRAEEAERALEMKSQTRAERAIASLHERAVAAEAEVTRLSGALLRLAYEWEVRDDDGLEVKQRATWSNAARELRALSPSREGAP